VKLPLGIAFVTAAALAVTAASPAGVRTTKPGEHTIVGVRITDTGIAIYPRKREVRGVVTTFTIENKGKKPHNFALLGQKTPKIRPGRSAVFTVTLLARGKYLYRSTLDTGAGFRGYFIVF
jgi:plastocyanin